MKEIAVNNGANDFTNFFLLERAIAVHRLERERVYGFNRTKKQFVIRRELK